MKLPNRETVASIRRRYPIGTRIELVRMDDAQAPPAGTRGTVTGVDDTASLLIKWDNGSTLNVIYDIDVARIVEQITTRCYGREIIWDSRGDAEKYFLQAMVGSEGSERERYTTIYTQLKLGMTFCSDDIDC